MSSEPERKFLSTSEAAKASGYTRDYLIRLARAGSVAAVQNGRNWSIDPASLAKFIEQQKIRKQEFHGSLSETMRRSYEQNRRAKKETPLRDLTYGEKFLTTSEAAVASGYTRDYLIRLARARKISAAIEGRSWRIDAASLAAFVEGQKIRRETFHDSLSSTMRRSYGSRTRKAVEVVAPAAAREPQSQLLARVLQTRLPAVPKEWRQQGLALATAVLVVTLGAGLARADFTTRAAQGALALVERQAREARALAADVVAHPQQAVFALSNLVVDSTHASIGAYVAGVQLWVDATPQVPLGVAHGALALADVLGTAPAATQNLALGATGYSAAALSAATASLSTGEQIALGTYQSIHKLFTSTLLAFENLFPWHSETVHYSIVYTNLPNATSSLALAPTVINHITNVQNVENTTNVTHETKSYVQNVVGQVLDNLDFNKLVDPIFVGLHFDDTSVTAPGNVAVEGTLDVTGTTTLANLLTTNATTTNATSTNLFATNSVFTNATSTNLFAAGASFTNATTSSLALSGLTQGSALFAGASGALSQDNGNFFYDATNHRLGLGTSTPDATLSLFQTANGVPVISAYRNTDSAPSGDFINFKTNSGTTLFRVDNSGNLLAGGIVNSGSQTITSTSQPQFRVQYDASNEWTASTNSTGGTTFGINGSASSLTFTPQSNSVNTFNFTNALGTNSIFSIDTQNRRVGIGSSTPTYALSVEGTSSLGNTAIAGYFTATSTTQASTFTYASTTALSGQTSQFTTASSTSLYVSSLTSGRVPYITTGNLLTDSTNLTFDGTTLTANVLHLTNALGIAYGGTGSTTAPVGQLLYGGASAYQSVATSSPTFGLGLTASNFGYVVGGSSPTLSVATSSLYTGSAGQIAYFSGTNTLTGTSDIFDSGGNIGIGTTSPSGTFAVANTGSSNPVNIDVNTAAQNLGHIKITRSGSIKGYIGTDSNDNLALLIPAGTPGLSLTSAGNVGIGNTNPAFKLSVAGSVSVGGSVTSDTRSTFATAADEAAKNILTSGTGYWGIREGATNHEIFFDTYNASVGATALTLTQGGNVGVGVTSSINNTFQIGSVGSTGYVSNKFAIGDGTRAFAIDVDSNGANLYSSTGTTFIKGGGVSGTASILTVSRLQGTNDSGGFVTLAGGTSGTTARGYIGYGKTGSGSATMFTSELADSFSIRAQGAFHLGTNGDNIALTVDTSQRVGIGTTGPSYPLHVRKDQNALTYVVAQNNNAASGAGSFFRVTDGTYNGYIGMFNASSGGSGLNVPQSMSIQTDQTQLGIGTVNASGILTFYTGSAIEKMRISSGGVVSIGSTATTPGGASPKLVISNTDDSTSYIVGVNTSDTPRFALNGLSTGAWTMYDYAAGGWTAGLSQKSGNVGIGTASPGGKLHVYTAASGATANATYAKDLVVESGAQAGMSILSPDANWGSLYFTSPSGSNWIESNYSGGAFNIAQGKSGGSINFYTNSGSGAALRMTLGSTGNLTLASGVVSASNFQDSTGTYNVNLGSGGSEGRGVVAGYSGGSYSGVGYNIRHTASSATYIAPGTDTSSYLLFQAGGFTFQGAGSGSAGRTLSLSNLMTISSGGNVVTAGSLTVGTSLGVATALTVGTTITVGTYGTIADAQSSYGSIALTNGRGGYYGLLFGTGTSNPNLMFDSSGNGGIYKESAGLWEQYYTDSTHHLTINASTDYGAALGVNGGIYASGASTFDSNVGVNGNLTFASHEILVDENPYLSLYAGGTSSGGIDLRQSNGTRWGYFYGDASGVGILHGAGGWAMLASGTPGAINTGITLYTNGSASLTIDSGGNATTRGGLTVTNALTVNTVPVVTAITSATSGAINLPDATVGGSAGFATGLHMQTIYNAGYREHLSLGSYRDASSWNGGFFVGLGGNDSYPTDYWLMRYGGTLSYSSGSITISNPLTVGSTIQLPAAGTLYLNGGSSYKLTSADSYLDTMNSGSTHDTLEINYRVAAPTKICASLNCATYSANFAEDGTVTFPYNTSTGGYVSIYGAQDGSGNLRFSAANPYISASSYLVIPGGAYFPSGTVYVASALQARGGIHNDTAAELTLTGGTSGETRVDSGAQFSAIDTGWALAAGYTSGNWGVRLGATGSAGVIQVAQGSTAYNLEIQPYGGDVKISGRVGVGASPDANFMLFANSPSYSGIGANNHVDGDIAVYGYTDASSGYAAYFLGAGGGHCYFGYGSTSWSCGSDENLKTNITTITGPDALARLAQIQGARFNWKASPNGNQQIGVIAQAVQKVFPEAISLDKDGYLGVDYSSLIGPLISGVNELNARTTYTSAAFAANAAAFGFASTTATSTILTADGTGVDIFKLATYNFGSVETLASALAAQSTRMDTLEDRIKKLEDGSIAMATSSPLFSTTTLITWFADASNGIGDFFASRIHTKQICVARDDGSEFCASGDQLSAMAAAAGVTGSSYTPPTGGSGGTGSSTSPTGGGTGSTTPPTGGGGGTGTTTPPVSADTTAPVVTLVGDAAMQLTAGDTFTDSGATATDETDGDLTSSIVVSGTVDTATAGAYTLTYSATDAAGNTGSVSRVVTVAAAAAAAPTDATPEPSTN